MHTQALRYLGAVIALVVFSVSVPAGPAAGAAGFGDVADDRYYTEAVQWLVDESITTGTSPGCFSPDRAVTRGEVATFLWRFAGRPSAGSEPFVDVDAGDFFGAAVAWMSATGITTGVSPTTFEPYRAVTRGEVATFLYRFAGSPSVTVSAGGSCGGAPPTTTTAPPPTTTTGSGGSSYFSTLPPGAELPSGEWCASQVKPAAETRSANTPYNATRGTTSNDRYPRVDGDFTGTTDEILQWAACKWGIDEDIVRAQAAKESWWNQENGGDLSSDSSVCHPSVRHLSPCPESMGILQVRYLYHSEAFEDSNAIRSTAYNADYTYAGWRSCYEGNETWLNDFERGAWYEAGDLWGCLGVWFSGRWYTDSAIAYIDAVQDLRAERVWEQAYFLND